MVLFQKIPQNCIPLSPIPFIIPLPIEERTPDSKSVINIEHFTKSINHNGIHLSFGCYLTLWMLLPFPAMYRSEISAAGCGRNFNVSRFMTSADPRRCDADSSPKKRSKCVPLSFVFHNATMKVDTPSSFWSIE